MPNTLALNVPHAGPAMPSYRVACIDVVAGIRAGDIWGRLGWRETKRRYRRTAFGPFWTTVSLALFVATLGLVWSNLWHKDAKTYLPYLTSGMLCWVLFVAICTEGCSSFIAYEKLIKQLRISYTLLACAVVWRNTIVFFHNVIIFVLVAIYAGISVNWSTFLRYSRLCIIVPERDVDRHYSRGRLRTLSGLAAISRQFASNFAFSNTHLLVTRSIDRTCEDFGAIQSALSSDCDRPRAAIRNSAGADELGCRRTDNDRRLDLPRFRS